MIKFKIKWVSNEEYANTDFTTKDDKDFFYECLFLSTKDLLQKYIESNDKQRQIIESVRLHKEHNEEILIIKRLEDYPFLATCEAEIRDIGI